MVYFLSADEKRQFEFSFMLFFANLISYYSTLFNMFTFFNHKNVLGLKVTYRTLYFKLTPLYG